MSELVEQVALEIQQRKLLKRGERVVVAVSGGVDSMVLLRVLHGLSSHYGWQLIVAHFNHLLRGRESRADQKFVARTAGELDLPFETDAGKVAAHAKAHSISLEMAGREMRHAFLARVAQKHGASKIALAHHADDNVEHFFLRLFRGTGGEGLSGMKWLAKSPVTSSISLIRPLLSASKSDLTKYAAEQRIAWREDRSNRSEDILRNRVRLELIPLLLERYQQALPKVVRRLMDIVGSEADYVALAAGQWRSDKAGLPFDELHRAVQRQYLRQELLRLGIAPDWELVEELRMSPGTPISVACGQSLIRAKDGKLRLQPTGEVAFNLAEIVLSLKGSAGTTAIGDTVIRWRFRSGSRGGRQWEDKPAGAECFDADAVGKSVTIRHWRPGDVFQPIGMSGPAKLQDLFTNAKIPREQRRKLALAATSDGVVFWVEGLRIGDCCKIRQETRRILTWSWRRKKEQA